MFFPNKDSIPLKLVQWVIWYEEFVVRIGLHATAN